MGDRAPPFSLETHTPLKAFDLLGFSLSYELSNTNLLTMLDLAGIPLHRRDRGETTGFCMIEKCNRCGIDVKECGPAIKVFKNLPSRRSPLPVQA